MNDVIARLRGQAATRDTSQCRAEQSLRNRPGTAPAQPAEDYCRAAPARELAHAPLADQNPG